jgi:hypothetical protein
MNASLKPSEAPLTAFDLSKSELVKLIREHLDNAKSSVLTRGPRVVFLPWFSPNEQNSRDSLKRLSTALRLPFVILPQHYSVTHDARLLSQLAKQLCSKVGAELNEALEKLPYTSALEDAVLSRIRASIESRARKNERVRLAVVALGSGADAHSSVSRMLDWVSTFKLNTVLVLAHKRPPGLVETIDLPVRKLFEDVIRLMPCHLLRNTGSAKRQLAAMCSRKTGRLWATRRSRRTVCLRTAVRLQAAKHSTAKSPRTAVRHWNAAHPGTEGSLQAAAPHQQPARDPRSSPSIVGLSATSVA